MVNSKLRFDVTATYRGKYRHSDRLVENGTLYFIDQHVSSFALMLNGYFIPKNFENFSPYLMVGGGITNNAVSDIILGSTSGTTRILGGHKQNIGWQIGIGSLFKITKYATLDLMYRYVDLGITKTKPVSTNSAGSLGHFTPVPACVKGHALPLGVNYKF